jgi:hypothetical protein
VIRPRADRIARAVDASRKAKWARTRFEDDRHPDTIGPALGDPDRCWCGRPLEHDWPGKSERAFHPAAKRREPMALRVDLPSPEHCLPGDTCTIHLLRACTPEEINALRKRAEDALPGVKIEIWVAGTPA